MSILLNIVFASKPVWAGLDLLYFYIIMLAAIKNTIQYKKNSSEDKSPAVSQSEIEQITSKSSKKT